MSNTKRDEYIDAIRGAVIILMLVGHSGAPKLVTTLIYGFHMPFFFILSGLLYNRTKWESKGLKKLVISKFKAYIIPYFILCGINIAIEIFYDYLNGFTMLQLYKEAKDSIIWVLYSYSTKARMSTSVPLWFLPCIFLSTILTYLFLKVKNRVLRGTVIAMGLMINVALKIYKAPPILPWHLGVAFVGAFFMIVGYYGKRAIDENATENNMAMILILSIIFLFCTELTGKVDVNVRNYGTHPFLFIVGSTAMSMALILLFKNYLPNSKVLTFLGQNTLVIMGFNYTINYYSSVIWKSAHLNSVIPYNWIVVCLLDIVACVIIIFARNASVRLLDNYRSAVTHEI